MTTHTEAQESYMAEEIAAIVHDLGFKALIERDDDGDVTIESATDGRTVYIQMQGSEPFFTGIDVRLVLIVDEPSPEDVNLFNQGRFLRKATAYAGEDGSGTTSHFVLVSFAIAFRGGVTPAYIRDHLDDFIQEVPSFVDFFDV